MILRSQRLEGYRHGNLSVKVLGSETVGSTRHCRRTRLTGCRRCKVKTTGSASTAERLNQLAGPSFAD